MRYRSSAFVFGFWFLMAALAGATSVIPLDFKTLTGNAEVIAHGRVIAVTSQWASDRNGIDSVVTLAVSDYLKGDLGAQLVFRVPGGTIGRWRAVRVGAPVFREGEEVVVFLASNGPTFPHIVGFNQGALRVSADPVTGARLVASPILAGEVTTPTPLVRGDPSRQPETLEQFSARVRAVLQQGHSARPSPGKPADGQATRRVR